MNRSSHNEASAAAPMDAEKQLPLRVETLTADESARHHHWSRRQSVEITILLVRQYIPWLVNIAAWYFTNGLSGISMQSFSRTVLQTREPRNLLSTVAVTLAITSLQLLAGAVLGSVMLLLHSIFFAAAPNSPRHKRLGSSRLSLFHGVGSLCTNLGFMYGSASLVQIIKLLEPFETLLLTKLLVPEQGKRPSLGVVCSMILTVGAAISLIQSRSTTPHPHAVMFALLSGFTLSSRNVLQRRQHSDHVPACETVSSSLSQAQKLERSLVQFSSLSLQSGCTVAVISFLLNLWLLQTDSGHRETLALLLSRRIHWGVFTWHPLYNAFSMIVLGFCSALTHSLLNAGKRVFAICMAILWFRENHGLATVTSLVTVAIGGCWYTMETKTTATTTQTDRVSSWVKPTVSIVLLFLVYTLVSL